MYGDNGLLWLIVLLVLLFGVFTIGFIVLAERWLPLPRQREPVDLSASLAAAFHIKPYLQLGDRPQLLSAESVDLIWHSTQQPRDWAVQVRVAADTTWRTCSPVVARPFTIRGIVPSLRYRAVLDRLPPGLPFEYRVLADGDIAFIGSGKARPAADQAYTFAVIGDLGTADEKREPRMANRVALAEPGMVFIPGDIVYNRGRVSEYLRDFFPTYNSDASSPESGGPVLRSTVVLGAPGNHDFGLPSPLDAANLSLYPDLFGYFQFWSQPLNGPNGIVGGVNTPHIAGTGSDKASFLSRAGSAFPRMASFSFDWGNSHWTVLDSNAYMDWSDGDLLRWLEADLKNAQGATWRFVSFHHPVFSSDGKHENEQRMRLLCPIFEKYNVDVVFNGHNHCYERTWPLRFKPSVSVAALLTEDCPVPGVLTIDTTYDGKSNTRPDGVIYVVDGAGGARFYPAFRPPADGLKPFTTFYDQTVNSFTHCQVDGRTFTARQISQDGKEIDGYVITK